MSWLVFGGDAHEIYLALLNERCERDGLGSSDEVQARQFRLHLHRGIGYLAAPQAIRSIADFIGLVVEESEGEIDTSAPAGSEEARSEAGFEVEASGQVIRPAGSDPPDPPRAAARAAPGQGPASPRGASAPNLWDLPARSGSQLDEMPGSQAESLTYGKTAPTHTFGQDAPLLCAKPRAPPAQSMQRMRSMDDPCGIGPLRSGPQPDGMPEGQAESLTYGKEAPSTPLAETLP